MNKPGSQIEIPEHPRKVRDFWQKLLLLMVTAQMQGPKDVIASRVRVGSRTDKSVENSNISWRIAKFFDADIIRINRWIVREDLFTNYNSAKDAIEESKDKILVPISTLLRLIGHPLQEHWDYPVFNKKGAGVPHGVELDKLVPENVPGHQLFRIAVAFGFCPKCPRDYLELAGPLPEMECDRVRWLEELQFNPERFDEWADEHKKPIENQQACAIWEAFAGKALEEDPEMEGGEPFDDFLTKWCDRVSHDNKAEQAGVLVNDENRPVELFDSKPVFEKAMLDTKVQTDRTATNSPSEVIPVDNGNSSFYLRWPQKVGSQKDLNGFNRLMYTSEIDEFIGREYEIKLLQDFAGDPSSGGQVFNFQWMLLTGEAGTGKTRLAYHFTESELDGWYSGKLDFASLKALHPSTIREWRPRYPTFIVIDYVECVPEEVGELLKVFTNEAVNFEEPVRLLLLARRSNEGWTDNLLKASGHRPVIEQHNFGGHSIKGKKIEPLSLDAIFELMKQRIQVTEFDVPEKNYLLSKAHDIDRRVERPRPLFALLAVEHYIEARRMGQDLPEKFELTAVLEDFIRRERDCIWRETITNEGKLRQYQMGLAVATLAQGIKLRDLDEADFGSGSSWMPPHPPFLDSGALAAFGCTGNYWPPMEPDLIGEYFFSKILLEGDLPKEKRVAIIEGAVSLGKSQAVIILLRLAQDFPERFEQLQLEEVVRATAHEGVLLSLTSLVFNSTGDVLDSCVSRIFDAVFEREDWSISPELGHFVATAAAHISRYAGVAHDWDRITEIMAKIDAIRNAFPQDEIIARRDADAACATIVRVTGDPVSFTNTEDDWVRITEIAARLDAVRKVFPQVQEIALLCATAAVTLSNIAGTAHNWDYITEIMARLDAVRKAFPQDQEIARQCAFVVSNTSFFLGVAGKLGLFTKALSLLDALREAFPQDQGIAQSAARIASVISHVDANIGDPSRFAEIVARLDAVRKAFPYDQEIAFADAAAAIGLTNIAVSIGNRGLFDEIVVRLDTVRKKFPHDQEIARAEARVAVNISMSATAAGDWGRFAEMKTKLDALRMEFPHDQEIARAGAKVAVNISNPSSGTFTHMGGKVGRNEPCPCGSGKKVKRCCGRLSKLH